jgi:hypothetical protein
MQVSAATACSRYRDKITNSGEARHAQVIGTHDLRLVSDAKPHTAELCGANPFDYLRALIAHPKEVVAHPADWLPWNYQRSSTAAAA